MPHHLLDNIVQVFALANLHAFVLVSVVLPDVIHDNSQYANNWAERSHEPTRVGERVMRRFKSAGQAQRFLGAHAAASNLFYLGRHLIRAQHYRDLRVSTFAEWSGAAA
jgi:putative transposase